MNRAEQRFLTYCAETYVKLGYTVGLSHGKVLVDSFQLEPKGVAQQRSKSIHNTKFRKKLWDSLSVVLDGIVCVDFDVADINSVIDGNQHPLPATWIEKTPRGWHYFYRLPDTRPYVCQVGYRPHLDLLVKKKKPNQRYQSNPGMDMSTWYGHALIAPSKGYTREHQAIAKNQLPIAPEWILTALLNQHHTSQPSISGSVGVSGPVGVSGSSGVQGPSGTTNSIDTTFDDLLSLTYETT